MGPLYHPENQSPSVEIVAGLRRMDGWTNNTQPHLALARLVFQV